MKIYEFIRKARVRMRLIVMYPFWRAVFGSFGRGSYIGARTTLISPNSIQLGEKVWIWGESRIEAVARHGERTYAPRIEIGDGASIQQNFHCTCAESVRIGARTTVTANVGIFDIEHPYDDPDVSPLLQPYRVRPVDIGPDCFIGMNSVILPGTKLGEHCVVGANSVVSGVFPDHCVIAGAPAKVVKRYDPATGEWLKPRRMGE